MTTIGVTSTMKYVKISIPQSPEIKGWESVIIKTLSKENGRRTGKIERD